MFRRICNPPKFTIRICNPLKPHIYKMMYVGERIANPHLETAGLQIRRNKYAYTRTADEPRKVAFYKAKGRLSEAKKPSFAMRKTAFYNTPGYQPITALRPYFSE